jgi:hypothetical protein
LVFIFLIGYLAIAFEHPLKFNKAASALLTGVCWAIFALLGNNRELIAEELDHHLSEISVIFITAQFLQMI